MMGLRAFGSMWRTMVCTLEAPMDRAALTKSDALSDRNCARTRRHTPTQPVTPMANSTLLKPLPSQAMIRMANSRLGKTDMTSTRRMTMKSALPPLNPAMAPSGTPISREIICATNPTMSEIRAPYTIRLK